MPRVKRGMMHTKNRRNILKQTKGFYGGRKNLIKVAKTAINKAGELLQQAGATHGDTLLITDGLSIKDNEATLFTFCLSRLM